MAELLTCLHCGSRFALADRLSPTANDGAAYFVRQRPYCRPACEMAAKNARMYQRHKVERKAKRAKTCPFGCGRQTNLARHTRRRHDNLR